MKFSNETVGNRTRYLPACSAVPKQTAPPRAPSIMYKVRNMKVKEKHLVIMVLFSLKR